MRASYALPGIFKPVNINGRWLFDGALVNPIPVSVCRALGARYVIAVNLNSDMCGRGTVVADIEASAAGPSLAATSPRPTAARAATAAPCRSCCSASSSAAATTAPGISTVMIDAFNIVQDRIARSRLAGDPPDAMIPPRIADFGLFDFHRADELIQRGAGRRQREIDDITREIDARAGSRHAPPPSSTREFLVCALGCPRRAESTPPA